MKDWYTSAELKGLTGIPSSIQGVINKANREGWESRQRKGKGGGKEYSINSLPQATQLQLARNNKQTVAAPVIEGTLMPAVPSEVLWQRYEKATDKAKTEAKKRLNALKYGLMLAANGLSKRDAWAKAGVEHNTSKTRLYEWQKLVNGYPESDWLPLLLSKRGGAPKRIEIPDTAWAMFKADYLRPEKPTAFDSYRRVELAASEYGWQLPSLKTFERRIKEIPLTQRVLLREGEFALMRLYPHQERTVQGMHAMEWINGDGYKHNVFVRWPDGQVERPKTWFWQDVYSRKILAFRVDVTENTDMLRLSIGDVFEHWGIPDHVTIDNTRAAANKYLTGGVLNRYRFKIKEDDPAGILTNLGVHVHWTSVLNGKGHGQAKPVERAFGVGGLGEWVDKDPAFAGAYTGENPMAKPDNYGEKAVPVNQFIQVLTDRITSWNARTGRRTEMCEGVKSFDEAFKESYEVSAIQQATQEQRRLWLLAAEAIKVQNDGSFTLAAGKHTGVERNRYFHNALHEYIGKRVVARFDPLDLHANAYVYTLDGVFICHADCINPVAFGDTETAREHNRARTQFIKANKVAAKAEHTMNTLEVSKLIPSGDSPEIENKVVRPMRQPNLGSHKAPALTEAQKAKQAALLAEFENAQCEQDNDPLNTPLTGSLNTPLKPIENNVQPLNAAAQRAENYQRWKDIDAAIKEGIEVIADDKKYWELYQKGAEFKSQQKWEEANNQAG